MALLDVLAQLVLGSQSPAMAQDKTIEGVVNQQPLSNQIQKGYSTDPMYDKNVASVRAKRAFLNKEKKQTEDIIKRAAIEVGADPEKTADQWFWESGSAQPPGNNPAGVKPSKITRDFLNTLSQDDRNVLTQLKKTREGVPTDIDKLKEMFYDTRTKFEIPKNAKDIKQLSEKQLEKLNFTLNQARQTGNWKELQQRIIELNKQFPVNKDKNLYFWVSQPLMQYPDLPSGVYDQVRAQTGKVDTSTWTTDGNYLIRTMPNGKVIKYQRPESALIRDVRKGLLK